MPRWRSTGTTAGVRWTALVLPPLGHVVSREDLEINGRAVRIYPNWVTPNFFETTQIPLLLGRTFAPGEKKTPYRSRGWLA